MRMNVLIIAQYFPPDFGGASTRAFNAAKGLHLQGCDVTVVCAFPHYPHGKIPVEYKRKLVSREELDGIKLIRTRVPPIPHSSITNRILIHLSFVLSSLLAVCYIKRPDAIFAMNPNLFAFFPALLYALLFRRKIIRNVDDLWPEVFYELGIVKSSLAIRFLDLVAKATYQLSSAIVPVSNGYVQTILTKYKIPKHKIITIEHGVDIGKFEKHIHAKPMRTSNRKIVMYSGVLGQGYDFETVIRAAKVLEQYENIHIVIRGRGELEETIRAYILEYGVTNVDLSTELLPYDEYLSVVHAADIFLLPMSQIKTIDSGFPTKILEYQAMGKPIICISSGESARYIQATQSGLTTASRDPKDLADLILYLVNNESLSRRLGTNGLTNVKENMTLEAVGKKMIEVINKCTKR